MPMQGVAAVATLPDAATQCPRLPRKQGCTVLFQAWLFEDSQHKRGVVVKSYRPQAFHEGGKPPCFKQLAGQVQTLQGLSHP